MNRILARVIALATLASASDDIFNYRATSDNDYGPEEWDKVSCDDLETCPGFPEKILPSIGWRNDKNTCRWCPITGNDCGQHRQSPIDLQRDRAIPGNPNEKECPDWHWIQYLDGTCSWEDMADEFHINRNGLSITTPLTDDDDIDCVDDIGQRKFPKLDYSKGFPDWWYLDRIDISVPSEHVQHGQRYAAEVKLSHFYEIDMYKNKLGIVSMFMQDFEGEPSWPYLDKLICKWRAEEEKRRSECGLDPAPVYKMCELYRGQVRTEEDMEAPSAAIQYPTFTPLVEPDPIPINNLGADPDEFRLPLGLCEGDCDFTTDCAPGLICYRREPLGGVPGCIGGEGDDSNTDYCVFDPFGSGYTPPTQDPTSSPTITARPTLVPLPNQPLVDHGGTPPASVMPLQLCEGDCDKDEDCALGLICFQRTSNEDVPGCIGGESDAEKTDYCILDPFGPGYGPSSSPVSAPNAPITRPVGDPLRIQNLGWEPPTPLPECAGDCDVDADCEVGLICYQRNTPNEVIPGCLGGDEDPSLTDYCTYPPLPTNATNATTDAPTLEPDVIGAPSSMPVESPTETGDLPAIKDLGWTPPDSVKPLGLCEGDCDIRQDCGPGLDCFQRYLPNVAVPGCSGGETDPSLTDYCIPEGLITGGNGPSAPAPTLAPEIPPPLDCSAFPDVNFFRMCKPDSCCVSPRSDSDYCQGEYQILGDAVEAACYHCCLEERGTDIATTAPSVVFNLTEAPGVSPFGTFAPGIPPPLDCSAFPDANFFRMCKNESCCTNPRSETQFCHEQYEILGEDVEAACHHCCFEERGIPMIVGPGADVSPNVSKSVQCDAVAQPERICRDGSSCCDSTGSAGEFCRSQYALYTTEEIQSICWYCCFPSKEVQFDDTGRFLIDSDGGLNPIRRLSREERKELYRPLDKKDRVTHGVGGRKLIVRKENFEEKGMMDEEAYFEELMADFERRSLQESEVENYEDVRWWPYEWFLKVGTEYYFRYEGTQTVPPCYDTAHWRVFKDPIRVSSRQMRELERLIAWRLGDNCEVDTAGLTTDNENRVDVARPLQSYHELHRKVFCECQDWPSKFPADRLWCRNWQNKPPEERLIDHPYNWPSDGFDFV